jgi:hypothetical protein
VLRAQDKRLHVGRRVEEVFPSFRPQAFSAVGEATGSSRGTAIPGDAAANTKGSWIELVSSSPIDADGFYLQLEALGTSRDHLVDIGIGAAGSEVVIVPNFQFSTGTGPSGIEEVYIPLPIPAGTRIAARSQATAGSQSVGVLLQLVQGELYRAMRCSRATAYGSNTADSGGVVVDPGAVAHTKGSWAEIHSGITNPIRYAILCIGNRANTGVGAFTQHLMDFGIGGAGAEVVLLDDQVVMADQTTDRLGPHVFARHVSIPAGTRLAARSQCSNTDATDRLFDLAVIGFD